VRGNVPINSKKVLGVILLILWSARPVSWTRSVGNAHRGRMCMREFIAVNICTYLWVYAYVMCSVKENRRSCGWCYPGCSTCPVKWPKRLGLLGFLGVAHTFYYSITKCTIWVSGNSSSDKWRPCSKYTKDRATLWAWVFEHLLLWLKLTFSNEINHRVSISRRIEK
jgi:hypothetical protein